MSPTAGGLGVVGLDKAAAIRKIAVYDLGGGYLRRVRDRQSPQLDGGAQFEVLFRPNG